jgi:hypothetical protein
MSNIGGKAYAMNTISPMRPWGTTLQRYIFMIARAFPGALEGLLGLRLIHFARWVIIPRDQWPDLGQGKQSLKYDYILFCSNFNGTWDQYIDAFSDVVPQGLDLFWYMSVKYPHSIPESTFKGYIAHNQIDTDYYYNATPGAAQRDIKSALQVLAELRGLAAIHSDSAPRVFAEAFRRSFLAIQNCVGSQGRAPSASEDAEKAERLSTEYLLHRRV